MTDGGFLVNFPLQYLDNEEMRPMYFSHRKTEKTSLLGFGITSLKPSREPEDLKRINEEVATSASKLAKMFMNRYGWCRSICDFLCHKCYISRKKTIVFENEPEKSTLSNSDIPEESVLLLVFLKQLLQTFVFTKDNLIEECLSHSVF